MKHLISWVAALLVAATALPAWSQVAISTLPVASTLAGTEVGPVVQSGATKRATINQFAARAAAVITGQINTFTGVQTINVSGAAALTPPTGTVLQLVQATGVEARLIADSYGTNTVISGRRADGTPAAPTAVQSGEILALFNGFGYGATGYSSTGRGGLSVAAAENWSDSAQGTQVSVSTTATGSTASTTRWLWQPAGHYLPNVDNAYDLGSPSFRIRGAYFGSSVTTPALAVGAYTTLGGGNIFTAASTACRGLETLTAGQTIASYCDNTTSSPMVVQNSGLSAAGQGVNLDFKLGVGNTSTPDLAARLQIINTADWSSAPNKTDAMTFSTSIAGTLGEKLRITSWGGLAMGGGESSSVPAFVPSGAGWAARLGDNSAPASISGSTLKTVPGSLASLGSAATQGAGTRGWVNDATQTFTAANFGATVTSGGANGVPVVSDGTNWKIGDAANDNLPAVVSDLWSAVG